MWNITKPNSFLPHFSGRMKTVKQKHVAFNKKEADAAFENLMTTGTVISATGSPFIPHACFAPLLPFVALPSIYLQNRTVSYKDVQVPMTPEEELAAMTPLERAHFQIQQALENWSKVRQEQNNTMQKLTNDLGSCEQELKALERETCPVGLDSNEFQSRLKMRLKARENSVQQQKALLDTAQKVFVVLDAEIQKREQNLFEAQEKLNMMQRQKSVIALHKQLEKIKGEPAQGNATDGVKETDQLALEMEKQQVEIEALMASLQTEMDVEAVLKSVESQKVQQ
jgi:hypothetical protein